MIQSIGNFMHFLQKERDLTLVELSGILGYKSPTSLIRIMQNKANKESLLKLIDRLRTSEDLALSPHELRLLDDILEMDQLKQGMDYDAVLRLKSLLKGENRFVTEPIMTIAEGETQMTMRRRYGNCQRWRGFLINSEKAPIFHALADLLSRPNFRLEHAMYVDENQAHTVNMICTLLPLLFLPSYEGYVYTLDRNARSNPSGLMTADLLICEYVTQNGIVRRDMVVFNNDNDVSVIESSPNIAAFETLLPPRNTFHSLRSIWKGSNGDYLAYIRFCIDLEKNHSIYRVKQDVGIDQIPVSILRQAADEGPMIGHPTAGKIINELEILLRQRWQQTMNTTKSFRHVMKQSAMWNFVRTGRSSDHFWGLRTFSMMERAKILDSMISVAQSRPNYEFYFLKADDDLRDDEFLLYEDVGLCVIKPGADYQLDGSHVETMIVQKQFQDVFRKFFMESIVQFHTLSKEESLLLLEQMRDDCLHNARVTKED